MLHAPGTHQPSPPAWNPRNLLQGSGECSVTRAGEPLRAAHELGLLSPTSGGAAQLSWGERLAAAMAPPRAALPTAAGARAQGAAPASLLPPLSPLAGFSGDGMETPDGEGDTDDWWLESLLA